MFPRKEASPKDRLGAKLKMIGAIHVVLGLACAVVGFCAIGIDQANIDFLKKENKTVEAYIILGLDSAPIVSSVWVRICLRSEILQTSNACNIFLCHLCSKSSILNIK